MGDEKEEERKEDEIMNDAKEGARDLPPMGSGSPAMDREPRKV